ncbi:MAG: type II toxin-antitoxin system RelE/ParE family toxin [Bacteroidaceae bacterium]|nr:type II toxin-antitoxin system RelE/ParE family toxin [Bacteroidaceae bacterium]
MEQADEALSRIANFISNTFGKRASNKLMKEVYHVGCLLEDNPYMGAIEPLLSDLPKTYRSIVVNRLNKIVYRIVENQIEIADFWDVRREPQKLAKEIK